MSYRHDGRWTKMHKGKIYEVSCKQLGTERTKDASRDAANAWWEVKAIELRGGCVPGSTEAIARMLDAYAGRHLDADEIPFAMMGFVEHLGNMPSGEQKNMFLRAMVHPEKMKAIDDAMDCLKDRTAIPPDRFIAFQIDKFLATKQAKVATGNLARPTMTLYANHMMQLKGFAGKRLVDTINDDFIAEYHAFLTTLGNKSITLAVMWTVFKMFIKWLDECSVITAPKRLGSKDFVFKNTSAKKPVWSAAEYQAAYKDASGVKRLVLLLGANCAMYISDMAECLAYVDFKTGTLTKARHKTKGKVREVTFHLWPETLDLLKKHGKELRRLYRVETGTNNTTIWKFAKPLKNLRHTTITFISNSEHGRYTNYCTGLADAGMSQKWYSADEQERIKQAFCYLRKCYGFA